MWGSPASGQLRGGGGGAGHAAGLAAGGTRRLPASSQSSGSASLLLVETVPEKFRGSSRPGLSAILSCCVTKSPSPPPRKCKPPATSLVPTSGVRGLSCSPAMWLGLVPRLSSGRSWAGLPGQAVCLSALASTPGSGSPSPHASPLPGPRVPSGSGSVFVVAAWEWQGQVLGTQPQGRLVVSGWDCPREGGGRRCRRSGVLLRLSRGCSHLPPSCSGLLSLPQAAQGLLSGFPGCSGVLHALAVPHCHACTTCWCQSSCHKCSAAYPGRTAGHVPVPVLRRGCPRGTSCSDAWLAWSTSGVGNKASACPGVARDPPRGVKPQVSTPGLYLAGTSSKC